MRDHYATAGGVNMKLTGAQTHAEKLEVMVDYLYTDLLKRQEHDARQAERAREQRIAAGAKPRPRPDPRDFGAVHLMARDLSAAKQPTPDSAPDAIECLHSDFQ